MVSDFGKIVPVVKGIHNDYRQFMKPIARDTQKILKMKTLPTLPPLSDSVIQRSLRSRATKSIIQGVFNDYPETLPIYTDGGYDYTGRKRNEGFVSWPSRWVKYYNYHLNGAKLTNALLRSPDKHNRQLGHIRAWYGGKR